MGSKLRFSHVRKFGLQMVLAFTFNVTSALDRCSVRGGFEPPIRNDESMGRIEMIVGPMFAGKSTELMRRIRRHNLACRRWAIPLCRQASKSVNYFRYRCIVLKYFKDIRNGEGPDELSTHDRVRIPAIPCQVCRRPQDSSLIILV